MDNNCFKVDLSSPLDISIPLNFCGDQVNYFHVPSASASPFEKGVVIGDTKKGGGCNFDTVSVIPHCQMTHTECVGHIVNEQIYVNQFSLNGFKTAFLISITPDIGTNSLEKKSDYFSKGDKTISGKLIEEKIENIKTSPEVLVVRTLPNTDKKCTMSYDEKHIPPYFLLSAIEVIKNAGFKHLCIDLPSLDRAVDGGELASHHLFWDVPLNSHTLAKYKPSESTITELIYVSNKIKDGFYLINLQVANMTLDASPSRPILFSVLT